MWRLHHRFLSFKLLYFNFLFPILRLGDGVRYLISCLQRLQLELHVASWNFATRDRSDHTPPFSPGTHSPILLN